MNKLLISLLSLTGVAGLSTGGYFLLRGNVENSGQKVTDGQGSGGDSEKQGDKTDGTETGAPPPKAGATSASSTQPDAQEKKST